MYTVTRQDAAEQLLISVRSVDRYVKSGKLRVKKEWKNILIHSGDIRNLQWGKNPKQHVIVNHQTQQTVPIQEHAVSTEHQSNNLDRIYSDLKQEILKKDEIIQTLAMRVGKAEEVAKNSISINDFKKSQFLLEESKWALSSELKSLKDQKDSLFKKLQYEKQIKILLLLVSIFLFLTLFFVWINNI